jgi:DNA-binding response OmpR family regulator
MKSMLIIDGSASLARLFAEIFQKRRWDVATCNDLESAMERLAGNNLYDVILLSHQVQGTAGVQLVSLIRSFKHRRMTPVIMMTGSDDITDEALAAGATKSCSNRSIRTRCCGGRQARHLSADNLRGTKGAPLQAGC